MKFKVFCKRCGSFTRNPRHASWGYNLCPHCFDLTHQDIQCNSEVFLDDIIIRKITPVDDYYRNLTTRELLMNRDYYD